MVDYKAPVQDYMFLFKDVLGLDSRPDVMGEYDLDTIEQMLEMAGQFSSEVFQPVNRSGDKEGVKHDKQTKKVTLPEGHVEAYQAYCEAGFPSFNADSKYGGQDAPNVLGNAVGEILTAGNAALSMLPGLSHGAYSAIHEYGSDELKDAYLPKMVSGEWAGVMALTEPGHGTDLNNLRSKAIPQEDGTFKISGEKIFISYGDQDATENIVHLVLAKMPDDPDKLPDHLKKGAGRVSLFLVPKYKLNEQGETTDVQNGVVADKLEEKMGIHASPTAALLYDDAEGYLVGAPGKGLQAMFVMMNEERLGVGMQGLGIAEKAYQDALQYAQERVQGGHIEDTFDKNADPVAIIEHPDVRRMLMEMKSFIGGARQLAMQTAIMTDIAKNPDSDEAERKNAQEYVDLMTPVIKAYLTDEGNRVTDLAVQTFGGHGYCQDHDVEQYQRDSRITRIYEGTNGVQALDLAGRKLPFKDFSVVTKPIEEQIAKYENDPEMAALVDPLKAGLQSLTEAREYLVNTAYGGVEDNTKLSDLAAGATKYLELMAKVTMGGAWLQQGGIAKEKLVAGNLSKEEQTFFEDKLATATYHQQAVLAPNHARLKDEVQLGADLLDMPGIYSRRASKAAAVANDNAAASIVAEGPKSAKDHATREAGGEISR